MMKRTATTLSILMLLAFALASIAYGEAKVVVKDVMTITVNKAQLKTDVPPISVNGQTLVPVRSIFNAFGAEIGWFPVEKKVFIRNNTQVIWLQIGDKHAKVNDAIVPLDAPAMIYRGRTMVPLRFIAQSLGAVVNWDPNTQTITITTRENITPGQPQPNLPGETVTPAGPQPSETVTPTSPPSETVTPPNVPPEQMPDDQTPAPSDDNDDP